MSMTTSSPLLKIIGIGVALSAVFIIFKVMTTDPGQGVDSGDATPYIPVAPEDLDETPETIRTLSAQVLQLQDQIELLYDENQALRNQEENIQSRLRLELQEKLESERERQTEETSNIFEKIAGRIDQIVREGEATPEQVAQATSPVAEQEPSLVPPEPEPPSDEIVWVEPIYMRTNADTPAQTVQASATTSAPVLPAGNQQVLTAIPQNQQLGLVRDAQGRLVRRVQNQREATIPVHTIPANATLIGSTLMTALIGQVAFSGAQVEPFPFKVIIGAENLASNGIKIPRVVNMIASGETRGDWTLSCVRGEINSVTFTFEDGTIQTVSGGNLGYLSDPMGIPCIRGKKIDNATAFIIGRMLAAATESVAGAFAKSEVDEEVGLFGTASNVRNAGKNAAFSASQQASEELKDYLAERQAQTFDAIFVEPGGKVAIHIEQQIPIDFNPNGRKVFHGDFNAKNNISAID